MGPLFFLLYVNDLPEASHFETTLFADDTNLHLSHSNVKTLQIQVSLEMKNIENSISENKLTINYKSAFMVISNISNPNSDFQISINDNPIDRTNTVKYLGVYLNSDLSWKTHIDYLAKRLSKVCGMIYKLHHFVPARTLKVVYFSMFDSVLQYSLLNWGRACKSYLQKLSILQNKIIRACLFCSRRDSTALLLFDVINNKVSKTTNLPSMSVWTNQWCLTLESMVPNNTVHPWKTY